MSPDKTFFHTLQFSEDLCIGCSHCLSVCPTEALRVKNGKSSLLLNQCIDCGKCSSVCPTEAISIDNDDFEHIFEFKYRVALIPSVFIGQFPENISINLIYNAIKKIGFTNIYEAENGVEILKEKLPEYQKSNTYKPLISTFCPAIVRLIQVRFPLLVENLVLQKTPMEIAALFLKKELMASGIDPDEIGIFYITPCAAKTVAIKDPVGEYNLHIAGSINMNVFFNKTYSYIKRKQVTESEQLYKHNLSAEALNYSLTGGETQIANGKSIAIDEINNVIDFLEKVENEEIKGIDFLELRACDQGCAGGVLVPTNKFLTVDRLKNTALKYKEYKSIDNPCFSDIISRKDELSKHISIGEVLPRSMMKLDDNISEAFKKMEEVNKILERLPKVDCTMCGAPNCKALATDIVQGNASIEHCIFIQKILEQQGEMTQHESTKKFNDIWGIHKTNKQEL